MTRQAMTPAAAGVLLDPLDDSGAYTANNGGTVADYTSDTVYPRAMKITAPINGYTQASAEFTADLRGRFLSFAFNSLDANFLSLTLGLSVLDTTYNKRFEMTVLRPQDVLVGKWHRATVPLASLTPAGSPATADLGDVRNLRFEVHATAAGATDVVVADLRLHDNPLDPGVVIIFDDGLTSTYTQAFPVMAPLGLVGSSAVIPNSVGQAGWMTLAQLQELQAAGWEACGHGTNGLAGGSASTIRTNLRAAYDYLTVNRLREGRGFFVYPGGSWDATVLRETRRIYGAARVAGSQAFTTPGVNDTHLIKPWYFTTTITLATAQAAIDKIADRGGLAVLTFHDLVASVSATEDWPISDFTTLMAYIAASGLKTYTPSQAFLSGART